MWATRLSGRMSVQCALMYSRQEDRSAAPWHTVHPAGTSAESGQIEYWPSPFTTT